MEEGNILVTATKQNSVVYYKKTKKQRSGVVGYIAGFAVLFSLCTFLGYVQEPSVREIANTATEIFNPIYPLYNDQGNIIFTANGQPKFKQEKQLKFNAPVFYSACAKEGSSLLFTVFNSIMVTAAEDGIVTGVGVLANNEKYIEIKHSNQITSRLENVDLIGVVINQLVEKGQQVATSQAGRVVKFSLYENGKAIEEITLHGSEITWQS